VSTSALVVVSTTIRAPRERVFAYRRDVTKLPEYNPNVRGIEEHAGQSYRFRVRLMPGLTVKATLRVAEAKEPERIVFEISSLMKAREVCTFEDADGGTRVRFEVTIDSPGGLIDRWFVVPSARRQFALELRLMKERLEKE
jgi:uncharacterized protein YndB with AHSA1/START domain